MLQKREGQSNIQTGGHGCMLNKLPQGANIMKNPFYIKETVSVWVTEGVLREDKSHSTGLTDKKHLYGIGNYYHQFFLYFENDV